MQLSICGSYADATDRAVFSAAVNKFTEMFLFTLKNIRKIIYRISNFILFLMFNRFVSKRNISKNYNFILEKLHIFI